MMPMHRSFADWYGQVSIAIDGPTLGLRWKAVESFADGLKIENIPDVIRIFYSRPIPNAVKEALRAAAKTIDSTFLMDKDDAELSILAGGVIADIVRRDGTKLADAVALGVSCMEADSLRRTGRIQGVVDDARTYLADQSVRVRGADVKVLPKLETTEVSKTLNTLKTFTGEIGALATATEGALRALVAAQAERDLVLKGALRQLGRHEETDILWWLFSECTEEERINFAELTVGEACFAGARDLAKLTKVLPGPVAARAFLVRALRQIKKAPATITIASAVAAFQSSKKLTMQVGPAADRLPDCCPLLFALRKCSEAGGGTWQDAFDSRTGLRSSDALPPASFAHEVYQELLFLRSLEEGG
jgi:hypothetical protein